jgi:hypothetical protein
MGQGKLRRPLPVAISKFWNRSSGPGGPIKKHNRVCAADRGGHLFIPVGAGVEVALIEPGLHLPALQRVEKLICNACVLPGMREYRRL